MALVIDDGTVGATGNATTLTAGMGVIASGAFGQATVEIVAADGLGAPANVYTFFSPGAINLEVGAGITVTATVVGSGNAVIDVSMI
jgi:hypothetical protein